MMNKMDKLTIRISKWASQFDFGSWPAFLMFMVVTTLGVMLNYLVMSDIVGKISALLVALLFEAGIISWKLTSWRKKNSDAQDEIANASTWISVVLATAMLIVNLFRAEIQSLQLVASDKLEFDGWTVAAFSIIGIAALVHVVSYLLFDGNDEDKSNARKNVREQRKLTQQKVEAANALANTEQKLKIVELIANELDRLQKKYAHLPNEQLEFVLEEARQNMLAMYNATKEVDEKTKALADVNGDGKIANTPVLKTANTYASETKKSF